MLAGAKAFQPTLTEMRKHAKLEARRLLDALSEAFDMLDGYDAGRSSRVAVLRARWQIPLDPTRAEQREKAWAEETNARMPRVNPRAKTENAP